MTNNFLNSEQKEAGYYIELTANVIYLKREGQVIEVFNKHSTIEEIQVAAHQDFCERHNGVEFARRRQ